MESRTLAELVTLADTDPDACRAALDALVPDGLTPAELVGLAELAVRLGRAEAAIRFLDAALAQDSGHAPALRRLCDLRRDQGDTERAAALLARLADLGDHQAGLEEIALLLEAGRLPQSEQALARLAPRCPPELQSRLLSLTVRFEAAIEGRTTDEAPDEPDANGDAAGPPVRLASDAELVALADLFAGREGVHARQWKGPDGRAGYSPVHTPLTPALVREHLLGAITLGTYVVRRDGGANFLALDVDLTRPALEALGRGPRRAFEDVLAKALAFARRLASALRGFGLSPVLEDSGHKGYHAWVFFAEPWSAALARRLARAALGLAGPPPEGVAVDVFPAQGRVPADGLGNLIKLPLGVHRKTGRKSLLLGEDGKPLRDPIRALVATPRASAEALEAALARAEAELAGRLASGAPDAGRGDEDGTGGDDPQGDPSRARHCRPQAAPVRPDYALDSDPEVKALLDRCAPLLGIVRVARAGRPLTHDERAVLTFTLGHLTHGPDAVNTLLPAAELGTDGPVLKSRLRGQPMGCRKIRARLGLQPDEERCDCRFDPTLGAYPHPLLHLAALWAEEAEERRAALAAVGAQSALAAEASVAVASRAAPAQAQDTPAALASSGGKLIPFPGRGRPGRD
ncbi:MAG TPA: CRISPR-associated primase-polymerase type A1 [Myxococcota bacterium]|nr:CRISPR-associated primase-polymerase type A1 [Myxococcota bacterium]HRY96624.1 CRISPR-associated primase-polymerase type A1 [Myxococcota bacterium]HSA21419.1 CRISPR-associated primase-polymerase type A1 [Myxococcota bacterium]